MKKRFKIFIVCAAALLTIAACAGSGQVDGVSIKTEINELLGKVQKAENDGLPQTAIGYLDQILQLSGQIEDYNTWLNALTKKLLFEGVIEGNQPQEKVERLKRAIETADENVKPVLKAILARWYWHFFDNARWRFQRRSETAALDDSDIMTWDLLKILKEIDRLYSEILQNRDILSKIPTAQFDEFLQTEAKRSVFTPTLYDFMVREAINFYTQAEQHIVKPSDAYELNFETDVSGNTKQFLNYKPDTPDTGSAKYKTVTLYQELIVLHQASGNRAALAETELSRILYVKNNAFGDTHTKNEVTVQRLREILEISESPEVDAAVYYTLAKTLKESGDLVTALEYARKGFRFYPNEKGGESCKNLAGEIEARTIALQAERLYSTTEERKFEVEYKNFTKIYFRVYEDKWDRFLHEKNVSPFSADRDYLNRLIKKSPYSEWSAEVAATPDYNERRQQIELPVLEKGFYRVFASIDNNFRDISNLSYTWLWVSDLGIVTRADVDKITGFILDNMSGEPVNRAQVTVYAYRDDRYQVYEKTETDNDGFFEIPAENRNFYNYTVHAAYGNDQLLDMAAIRSLSKSLPPYPYRTVILLTDRSLYRPGQSVHFKGIIVDVDHEADNYKVVQGQDLTVTFFDVNGEKVEELPVQSNDFGSFSGTFTAPADRLTGQMTIRTREISGLTLIRVEAYKRPKFMVELKIPDKAYRTGDMVIIPGQAISYSGASVNNAGVRYRVRRQVRYPFLQHLFFRLPPVRAEVQEIAYGTTLTDDQGRFIIEFEAKPDRQISIDDQPVFHYTVYCDVTDSTGETRSSSINVNAGYHCVEINISAKEYISTEDDFSFSLKSSSLNGASVASEGTVDIFKLLEPEKPVRDDVQSAFVHYSVVKKQAEISEDKFGSDWKTWAAGKKVLTDKFITTAQTPADFRLRLEPGFYRIVAQTIDRYGKAVERIQNFIVLPNRESRNFSLKLPFHVSFEKTSLQPGDELDLVWATGYPSGRAYIEIVHRGQTLRSFWTDEDRTQQHISFPVEEVHRGGFGVSIVYLRENRFYIEQRQIDVPHTNRELELSFETFRDRLYPGETETWKINIRGRQTPVSEAELVSVLYDSSLDAFYPHIWQDFNFYRSHRYLPAYRYSNSKTSFSGWVSDQWKSHGYNLISYWRFPPEITRQLSYYQFPVSGRGFFDGIDNAPVLMMKSADNAMEEVAAVEAERMPDTGEEPAEAEELDHDISIRENLQETAFFYPHLVMQDDGSVTIEFTMPEALTRWRFMGFAHGRSTELGMIEAFTVTQKELMIEPNPPRFLRENDIFEFTAKISNLSETRMRVKADIVFTDLFTGEPVNSKLAVSDALKTLPIEPGLSETVSWQIQVPLKLQSIRYQVSASAERFSDAQAGAVPVLSSRMLIKESLSLWITEAGMKTFEFENVEKLQTSASMEPVHFSVEMSSNPAWYAVQALPYLIEYPYESLENTFNRYYANSLAGFIADSRPAIRKIFDTWKNDYSDQLTSPLEKNEELKSILLKDTPWVAQSKTETQQRAKIGFLFEKNNLAHGIQNAYQKLASAQNPDGSFPWIPGGGTDTYMTLYILTGFGRLRHLGVSEDTGVALRALDYMDNWVRQAFNDIPHKERNNLSNMVALYLYARSFYTDIKPLPQASKPAVDYFLNQAVEYWLSLNSRLSQGYLALALNRFNDRVTAEKIMNSIYERSVLSEEMGRFWREDEQSLYWYRAPIETQAIMIEAFDEVTGDGDTVEQCRVWLLKQKQTQNWKSSKATADAVYSLILRGTDILSNDDIVKVTVAGTEVEAKDVAPGVNHYQKIYSPQEVTSEFKNISVERRTDGAAWGGAYFHYLEDISEISRPHQDGLNLEKSLWVKRFTKKGAVMDKLEGELQPGDRVIMRLVLRTDRDLEYVHLKDYRASSMEPENVLSIWKYQDGLRYYEATGDTSTDFFISYMPKGTYVFEYPVRIQNRGVFQTGPAMIQCLYAPEFSSHSESIQIRVGRQQVQ